MKPITNFILFSIICTIFYSHAAASDIEAGIVGIWAYRDLVTDSATLNYKQNNLRIMLKYPSGVAPDSVEYRFKLDGYDADWRSDSAGPWVFYNDLAPDDYILMAQCKIKGGQWSETAYHNIIITKPWWLKWPAILTYVLVTLSIVIFIIILVISRIRLSNQMKLEKANQNFRNELILHATRKFRTPLIVIKSIIEKLNEQNNYLSQSDVRHLRSSSRTLMQMLEELADYGRNSSDTDLDSDTDLADNEKIDDNTVPLFLHKEVTSTHNDATPANADITVMIVSPHNNLNDLMCKQMQAYFNVCTTIGNDVYDVIAQYKPNAIVLDTDVTEINAYTLIEKLKSNADTAHIPIILISSFDNSRSIIKAIKSKADDYLTKPFNVDVLAALVVKKVRMAALNALPEDASKTDAQTPTKNVYYNLSDKEFMQKINVLVDEHLADSTFNVGSMAKELAMNRIVLCYKVKNLCGKTPVEYLRDKRLDHAASLLTSTSKSINEIREMVGITDATYFHRRFKEKFSVSPRSYRQNFHSSNNISSQQEDA